MAIDGSYGNLVLVEGSRHCLLFVARLSPRRHTRRTGSGKPYTPTSRSWLRPTRLESVALFSSIRGAMGASKEMSLVFGTVAAASDTAVVILNIIFAVTLFQSPSPASTRATSIVASGISSVSMISAIALLIMQIRHRNGAHIQDYEHGKQHRYLLAGFTGVFCILSGVTSAMVLGFMSTRLSDIPKRIVLSSTKSMIIGGFIVWAISLISQAIFVILTVIIQRRDSQQQTQPYRAEPEPHSMSEIQEVMRPRAQSDQVYRETDSMDLRSPLSLRERSRSGSYTVSSFQSSLNHVVRPVTSKTRLITPKMPRRPASLDFSGRDARGSMDDGFDSWDTSTVDAQSRQAVESLSPKPARLLGTIPASPSASRSPSPGYPLDLDLKPPKQRQRSRSGPANSHRDRSRTVTSSSSESMSEAHIHPLFRTDSPTPPPPITPGTMVIAAPGAGSVISDRSSIRSVRMRNGSLPSSPLIHSKSMESMRGAIEKEERPFNLEEIVGERKMTPPIPDWIMTAGMRSSMTGYNSRKKTQMGLGKVGEDGDA